MTGFLHTPLKSSHGHQRPIFVVGRLEAAQGLPFGHLQEQCLTNLALLNTISIMSNIKYDLGIFLASARNKLGLTLRAVEEETGISNAYLSQLEHGKIKTPAPQNLYKLSEIYHIPYELLMELAGYPVPETQSAESRSPIDTFAARVGIVSEEEEEALVEYLQFIRSRKRRR